jgi:hypothetical protein
MPWLTDGYHTSRKALFRAVAVLCHTPFVGLKRSIRVALGSQEC